MNVPAQVGAAYKSVPIEPRHGGGVLMPTTFGEVVSFSEIMARSQHAIPKHLRDVPGACMAVTMQAMRWSMDPFAVASKSYNVKDIISYEAQLIAAVVHTRAPLKSRPNYVYSGTGQDRRCTVSAVFEDGIERSYESPKISEITVKNSPLWKADPDQQLGYFSIRSFARRYCPEVILGVYTPEEAEQFRGPDNARDVTPKASLSERLTAQPNQAEGFSVQHVVNEIDGTPSTLSSQESPQPVVHPETETPASDASPSPSDAGTNSELSEETSRNASDDTGGGDAGEPSSPSTNDMPRLPEGWGITYAAALRRAQKKESLPKYAAQFWSQYGGWDVHKNGPHSETAAAIFNAFNNNFGNKDAVEAELRELL